MTRSRARASSFSLVSCLFTHLITYSLVYSDRDLRPVNGGACIKWYCPNSHSPRGRSQPLNRKRRPLNRMGMVIEAPLSDLITIEAGNIWGKLFLSRRLFIWDQKDICLCSG